MDLSTSSNEIKVSFIQICFQSLLSLKQVCCACFERICEALVNETFAERFVKISFNVLVNFAVGYKYTNLSKRGKNFAQDFFSSSLSAKLKFCRVVFSFSARLSFAFFPRAQGGRDSQTPNQNLANFSPFP